MTKLIATTRVSLSNEYYKTHYIRVHFISVKISKSLVELGEFTALVKSWSPQFLRPGPVSVNRP